MPYRELVAKKVEQAAGNSGVEGLFVTKQEKKLISTILLNSRGVATEEAYQELLNHIITPYMREEGNEHGIQKSLRRCIRRTL